MDDAEVVRVVQAGHNLAHKLARLALLEALVRDQVVEHLAALAILQHQVKVLPHGGGDWGGE